jgi:hydrogenase expression/formation protein HypC
MCVAVPGKVISINKDTAVISYMDLEREIDISLIPNVKVGDYVIVHAGFAIQVIDHEEAIKSIELFDEIEGIGK